MQLVSLSADEALVRRFVTELWLPYHRTLAEAGHGPELGEDVDVVDAETAYRREKLEGEDHDVWIAVDDGRAAGDIADAEPPRAGFVTADFDGSPPVFERPDRLVVGDIYVRERYRGTGLATTLLERVQRRARDRGCGELALDVQVTNDRAIACYEKFGFEARRHRMALDLDDA